MCRFPTKSFNILDVQLNDLNIFKNKKFKIKIQKFFGILMF